MRTSWNLALVLAACGCTAAPDVPPPPTGDADTDSDTDSGTGTGVTASGIASCASSGTPLEIAWQVNNLAAENGRTVAMTFDADETIVLATDSGKIKQWILGEPAPDSTSPAEEPQYGVPLGFASGPVADVDFSADGLLVASADAGGAAMLWSLPELRGDVALEAQHAMGADPLVAVALSPDASRVATADDQFGGHVQVWQVGIEPLTGPLTTQLWGVSSLAFTPAGTELLVGGHIYGDATVEVRDAGDPATVLGMTSQSALGSTGVELAITPDSEHIVAVTRLGFGPAAVNVLRTSDVAAGPLVRVETPAYHDPAAVSVSPAGDLFATAGAEGVVRIWDLETATPLLEVNVAEPVDVGFDATGDLLVVPSADGLLRAYRCGE